MCSILREMNVQMEGIADYMEGVPPLVMFFGFGGRGRLAYSFAEFCSHSGFGRTRTGGSPIASPPVP